MVNVCEIFGKDARYQQKLKKISKEFGEDAKFCKKSTMQKVVNIL